jgi:hypothetical protein
MGMANRGLRRTAPALLDGCAMPARLFEVTLTVTLRTALAGMEVKEKSPFVPTGWMKY